MNRNFILRLYENDNLVEEKGCLALSMEREAYTPYNEITATFCSQGRDYGRVNKVALFMDSKELCFFEGLADSVTQYRKNAASFVRIHAKSFTSVLTQNEIEPGMHSNLTMEQLMTGFYTFPGVKYQNYDGTGYIFVRDGTSMWDSIANFAYKLTGHYPFVQNNTVMLLPETDAVLHTVTQALEYGTITDHTRLISHYHMEDIAGNYNAYSLENTLASEVNIVRHKQLSFDKQYLYAPEEALKFRCLYSDRGCRGKYVVYDGFDNEHVGEKLTFGSFLQNAVIGRVKLTAGAGGVRTKLWAYDDGFYHID